MKHFMQPRNPILRENSVDTPPSNPSSIKQTKSSSRKQKSSKENAPPSDINAIPDSSPSFTGKPSPVAAGKLKSPLPPRPPPSNPLKRKLSNDFPLENGVAGSSDTGVKVIVRMRPANKNEEEGEMIVQKTSGESLSIVGQPFTFDSVADGASTQVDIFQLVGAPLVENCLSGFNSSVFAYGQTGSGKTYTIWGPANALLEEELSSDQQGLTPRVFEQLFFRITEEQSKHADKQLMYQCRCSFLEIYNEQITDLLNPAQGNLHIREDTKTGVYVENLTEESVSTIKDVKQLLKKGLSNRRIGATSINLESSRSHSVFTCVVESRCKSMDGLSSFKTSRINLVDLAGSERQKLTGAAGERLKEAGNINRSLSQLGNLINILAEVSQTGKQRHIPYRDSKLTFLLQESLGGNAKLAMVCAISPAQSCKSETFSTLRFAQRAKAIKNKAVVNEQMQDDVNTLREVIRQLKDELLRMKANGNQADPSTGYSTGWNARRSLNLLKFSLNRPMMLHQMDDDMDEEMEIVQEAEQVLSAATEAYNNMDTVAGDDEEISVHSNDVSMDDAGNDTSSSNDLGDRVTPNLMIVPSEVTLVLKSPTPSVSPRVTSSNRKSLRTSSTLDASPQTDRLAASLHRGLEVIDKHRKSSALGRSSFRFSYKPVSCEPTSIRKDVGVQTLSQEKELAEEKPIPFLCSNCKCKSSEVVEDGNDGSNLQLVPVDDSQLVDKSRQLVPKVVEKVLAGAIRREMALEEFCTRQNFEIMQLNRLVQQYKHERECSSIIGQLQEDKIARLEKLMDGVLSAEEFVDEELTSLANEHKILKEKYENHPEILRTETELRNVQDELERYKNFHDMGERDVLLEEIQDLRTQLQSYIDCSPKLSQKQSTVLQITYPCESDGAPSLSTIPESTVESAEQRFESERIKFIEAESKWISLAEELKCELEASRLLAEKQKQELDIEKKCSEELKEAMQMAMEGHARMLEQYADLEERHINMLIRQRRIQDGIEDVKKAATRAGVRGAESKFINALAAEISALKVEREKERRHFKDENKGLQAQLRDTAEAVQAAGELLVRLKEAEEAVAAAETRARDAEQETENAYKQIERLKKKQKNETPPPVYDMPIYDGDESNITFDQQPRDEFYNIDKEEFTTLPEPSSWFSGYDRCNI
ncbi:kinesin-like protein KIN-12A [Cynara cardunculus var. scolymus]|uniref:kinesin-like protein KIN-12A n=1 Tax=Cynara cardunculus var. scolymus TaxID=59895 RepID=UPI000D62B70C|nr:kinesin-like protein KIN-12A [Cynara cardunculus var. scolymus]